MRVRLSRRDGMYVYIFYVVLHEEKTYAMRWKKDIAESEIGIYLVWVALISCHEKYKDREIQRMQALKN